MVSHHPVDIYLLKVNNRNTRTRCEICSKLTKKTLERRHWRRSSIFSVNFEHISRLVLVFLLLTLSMWLPAGHLATFGGHRHCFSEDIISQVITVLKVQTLKAFLLKNVRKERMKEKRLKQITVAYRNWNSKKQKNSTTRL